MDAHEPNLSHCDEVTASRPARRSGQARRWKAVTAIWKVFYLGCLCCGFSGCCSSWVMHRAGEDVWDEVHPDRQVRIEKATMDRDGGLYVYLVGQLGQRPGISPYTVHVPAAVMRACVNDPAELPRRYLQAMGMSWCDDGLYVELPRHVLRQNWQQVEARTSQPVTVVLRPDDGAGGTDRQRLRHGLPAYLANLRASGQPCIIDSGGWLYGEHVCFDVVPPSMTRQLEWRPNNVGFAFVIFAVAQDRQTHFAHKLVYLLLPPALAVDVVTAPVQLPLYLLARHITILRW